MTGDVTAEQTVQLKQGQDGWQRFDPVTIAGITHAADEGDTDNWKGSPTAHGTCRVSYVEGTGVVLTWSGEGTKPSQPARPTVDLSENLHGILKNSGLLETDLKDFTARGKFYEIDSSCPNSTMVPKVQAQIGKNSLLSTGTWDFRKISGEDPGRYLFWTSVDVTKFAVGTEVPVLVSKEDGGMFYITTMPVTTSTLKNQTYNVIGKGITKRGTLNPYIQGTEYTTLEEAYAAYADMVKNGYSQYADTLPK